MTAFATVASMRLFIAAPHEEGPDSAAIQNADVAGRVDVFVPDEIDNVNPAPEPITVSLNLDRSASIVSYLEDAGLSASDAQKWSWLIQQTAGTDTFQGGHALTLYKDPGTSDLRGLKYNLNDRVAVQELTYGAGVLRASPELIRYVFRPVAVSFRLGGDFWREARRNDLPKSVVATLDYAFKDHHPLGSLPRGSDIKLIYQEKVSRDGSAHFVTGLQAAEIRFGSRTLTAVAFRDEAGQPRLYDANGQALGVESLRYPLNFQYISSGFSLYRYHPILHEYRPHVGVDLVARYGTPVKAVADGRIETAGWCGELGRCVRIRHDGGIVSIYGHLSQIPPGLGERTSVRVGQVIGRVGSSGLSTGPHLHYALEKDGRYVNPLNAVIGVNHPVSPRMRALFDHFKEQYVTLFSRLPAVREHSMFSRPLPTISVEPAPGVNVVMDTGKKSRIRHPRAHWRPVVETTAATMTIDGRASVLR